MSFFSLTVASMDFSELDVYKKPQVKKSSIGTSQSDFNTICRCLTCAAFNDVLVHRNLKQIVRDPTRGNSNLDLILTDICNRSDKAVASASLGTPDRGSL